jgi:gamma-glutamylcyclotransferase (GGCT)/AIG2-like uncharacterized protein YtfP
MSIVSNLNGASSSPKETDDRKVFVYGSLRKGFGLSPVLSSSDYVDTVKTKPKYTMYSLGAFPCIVKGGNTAITGEIYNISLETERRLDMIEGVPQLYRKGKVEIKGYRNVLAYFFTKSNAEGLNKVETGDWAQ